MESLNILCFKFLIEDLVKNIADSNYDEIEKLKQNGIIPISDLVNRILEYGEKIVPLPVDWLKDALVYNIKNKRLDVYIPLWVKTGKSDLTLSVSCFYNKENPQLEINDLEVL